MGRQHPGCWRSCRTSRPRLHARRRLDATLRTAFCVTSRMGARAETEEQDDTSDFIDERARGEYVRLGAACFLVAVTNAHSALLAIVFARGGYDLHDIGLLLSIFALPVVLSGLVSGAIADRLGARQTLCLALVLLTVG